MRSKPEQGLPRNGAAALFAATIWCAVNPDRAYTGYGCGPTASGIWRGARSGPCKTTAKHGPDAIWSLVAKIGTTMLVTRTGESFDARPMQAYPDAAADEIAFLTDSQRVISEVNSNGRVLLTFSDKTRQQLRVIDRQGRRQRRPRPDRAPVVGLGSGLLEECP